jgi:ABC-type uncharacterized transport system substrate-binding protein
LARSARSSVTPKKNRSGTRLQLLKQAFPGIARVSVLMNPQNVSASSYLSATKQAAEALGISIATLAASIPEELRALGAAEPGACRCAPVVA